MGSNEAIGERGNNIVEKGFDVPASACWWLPASQTISFVESRHVHLERLDTRQTGPYIAYR